jgi:tetratricopeptide (TPR) repeat protein
VASRFRGGGIHTEPLLKSERPIGLNVGPDGLPPWTPLRVFERSEDKVWLRVSVVVKEQRFEGWMHRNVVTFIPVLAQRDLLFEDHADGLGWSDRCYLHLKAFRLGYAKAACNKGLASNPSLRWKGALLYNLGLIAEAEGDVCEAWSFHLRALEVLPGNKDVLNAIDRCRNDLFGSRCPQASTDNEP